MTDKNETKIDTLYLNFDTDFITKQNTKLSKKLANSLSKSVLGKKYTQNPREEKHKSNF